MAEKLKGEAEGKNWAEVVMGSARQIWLAGLGAFARAQAEGSKVFDSLVKEGEAIEARTRQTATQEIAQMSKRASGAWDKLEQVFEQRVSRSLNRLGVPSHGEIEALSKQVAELNTGVKSLLKQKKEPTAAPRAAPRKSAKGVRASAS
jgi:poly(hydroxyalkanoate) granule-associated protein